MLGGISGRAQGGGRFARAAKHGTRPWGGLDARVTGEFGELLLDELHEGGEGGLREIKLEIGGFEKLRQGLEKVLNYLRDVMAVNVWVDWQALAAAGVERGTPVSVNLKEVPLRKVLTTVLAQVDGEQGVTYLVEDGVVTISTKAELAKHQLVTGLSTMLSVPGGQTAVIGGMKFAGEFPVQDGYQGWKVAPAAGGAVGSLPARNLVLLVRPEIIVHKEME